MNQNLSSIPKIGKRGWTGVILMICGLLTILGAHENAADLQEDTYKNGGSVRLSIDDSLAKGSGYNSYADYLESESRKSGAVCLALGFSLAVCGYRKQKKKKSISDEPPIQVLKSISAEISSSAATVISPKSMPDQIERLERLARLKSEGHLTESEFLKQKHRILAE